MGREAHKNEEFIWKGEVRFRGNAEQFNELMVAMAKAQVEVIIPEWEAIHRHHLAGCSRVALDKLVTIERLHALAEGSPQAELRFVQDIDGGIRTAHFHLGDKVVLLGRERFKALVGEVAQRLAERRVDVVDDYIGVMKAVGDLYTPREEHREMVPDLGLTEAEHVH